MKNTLQSLTGSKRYFAAFALGAVMTLAMPPIGFFPVLLVSVPGLIWLSQNTPTKTRTFLTGWLFGAGYFIFGLYWISAALFVDIGQWGWVLPLSLVAGPAALGLYYGFIPLIARRWRMNNSAYAAAIVIAWSLIEYARGHLFTGFPWNLPGYAWDHALPVMQIASVTGVYGLTLLTLFWAATPVFDRKLQTAAVISFAFVIGFGATRLWLHPTEPFDHYTVRVVQAAIPQTMKWNQDEEWRNLEKHLILSKSPGPAPTFVVWPETAVTADLKLFPEIARVIAFSLPEGSFGVLGSLRVTEDGGTPRFFNSVTLLDKSAAVIDTYDKHHLVPFGEYIPFRDKISFTPLALAVSGIGDFTRGAGVRTLKNGSLPSFSPLVCYEIIFPGAVANREERPDWLVNVTNDAWYGHTAGPYQHLAISRLRTVEEGLPLVRAANTGISAVIDPLGRELATKPLGESGIIDSILPHPLPPTLYARFGNLFFFLLLLMPLQAVAAARRNMP